MKIAKIVAGVVTLLIVAVVAVLLTVDVNQYRGLIQDQAKAATGREVTVGDIKLALSLTPAIVVSDVKVANAPWGSRPEMLTLKRAEASTQLIPLLFGTVNISGLKLVDADVLLETNADGKGNWEFETAAASASAAGEQSVPLNVSGVSAENLKLVYRDGKTKDGASVTAKSIEADIEGALTDLNIPSVTLSEATVSYKSGAMAADGAVKDFALTAVGPITHFNITKLTATDLKGTYKDGPAAYQGAAASLTVEGQVRQVTEKDIMAALKAMNLTKFSVEKASGTLKDATTTASADIGKITAEAKGKIGDLGITNLSVAETKASYKGEGAPTDLVVDKLALDDKGVLDLAAKFNGQDVKASGTLAPIASLIAMNKSFPAKVKVEGFGVKADSDIMVDLSKKRPHAKGAVTIPELDLAALGNPAGGAAPAPAAKASGPLFSNDPLPWDSLTAADSDVKVSITKLTLPSGLVLKDVVLPVDLQGGKLSMKPASFGVAGGTLTADVDADANDKSVVLKVQAKGISAESLTKEMKKSDLITQGPIDLDLNVRGAGNSMHAIAGSMNGSVIAGMGESRIRNEALNMIGADVIMQVLSALNPVGNKDPYTVARCGVVNLQIANGVANTNNGIALVTDKMQVTSSGRIDLANERVDLNVRPKATGGLGAGLGNLVSAVKVQGPLASPGIGIDKAGAVKALGTLGAAFATGGASLLAQGAMDRADAATGGDPCQIARTWHLKK
jgi:uncharacterized protein involved in outer membrane biogenesis